MGNFDPMSPFKMSTRIEVEALQWTGDNLDEMKRLLVPYVEGDTEGPFVYFDYVEPYYFASSNISGGGYNMLKFYAWGDDQEVDPGQWVVVYGEDEGEIMDNEQFQKMGFK